MCVPPSPPDLSTIQWIDSAWEDYYKEKVADGILRPVRLYEDITAHTYLYRPDYQAIPTVRVCHRITLDKPSDKDLAAISLVITLLHEGNIPAWHAAKRLN
eukprot:GHVU01176901.1.p1 GENE.GHVU01176901.1~~GHVU01176901.1.p1  ORF type:complete len:101 (-),score=5.43 GHVU01176901.1:79-381(-)